jgi:hypothetical protein
MWSRRRGAVILPRPAAIDCGSTAMAVGWSSATEFLPHRLGRSSTPTRGAVRLLGLHPSGPGTRGWCLDGSVGDGYDNAIIEAFWSRMQVELLDRHRWRTRVELANAILRTWRSSTTDNAATAASACRPR